MLVLVAYSLFLIIKNNCECDEYVLRLKTYSAHSQFSLTIITWPWAFEASTDSAMLRIIDSNVKIIELSFLSYYTMTLLTVVFHQ